MKAAQVASTARIGQYVVIEDDVWIGENVEIGHGVILRQGVRLGEGCRIGDGTILGKLPAKASLSATTGDGGDLPPLVLGKNVTVGPDACSTAGPRWGIGFFWETSPRCVKK